MKSEKVITHVKLPDGELYELQDQEDPWAKNCIWDSLVYERTSERKRREEKRRFLMERKGRDRRRRR